MVQTKLFSDVYPAKFLDTSAKLPSFRVLSMYFNVYNFLEGDQKKYIYRVYFV